MPPGHLEDPPQELTVRLIARVAEAAQVWIIWAAGEEEPLGHREWPERELAAAGLRQEYRRGHAAGKEHSGAVGFKPLR